MSLIRHASLTPITRLMLAVALVCALLATQFALNRHVVEHASSPTLAATQIDNDSGMPDGPSCLTCLEHQTHGTALTSSTHITLADGASPMQAQGLPHNAPYLTPERASQRAPPTFS